MEPSPESVGPITQPMRKRPEVASPPATNGPVEAGDAQATTRADTSLANGANRFEPLPTEDPLDTLAIRKLRSVVETQPSNQASDSASIEWPSTTLDELFAKRQSEPPPPSALNELDSKRPRSRSSNAHPPSAALPPTESQLSSTGVGVETATLTVPCPKCQKPVTLSAAGLGYCSACGYCGTFDGSKPTTLTAPKPLLLGPVQKVVDTLPVWSWVLLGGMVAITLVSLTAEKVLLTPQLRAYWAAGQLVSGLVCFWVAQGWMFVTLALDDTAVDWRDIFVVSGRLWKGAAARLPEGCRPIWLGSWGIWMSLSAFLFVGGTRQWLIWLGFISG